MAHNIEFNESKGTYSFVEANKKELAWHRLGQQFDQNGITCTEAIKACNADYQVSKQPLVALTPAMQELLATGEAIPAEMLQEMVITNKMATMRLDNNRPLGIVGDGYGIVQNVDAFRFIDQLVTGGLTEYGKTPCIDAAGVLGNGERIFVTAKFPEQIRLDNKGNDMVDLYLVFTTSHDGSGSVVAMATPVRVVCNNTLNFALKKNEGRLNLRHTTNVMSRLDLQTKENKELAYKALNLMSIYKKSFEEKINALKAVKVTDEQAKEVLKKVFLPAVQYDLWKTTGDLNAEGISTKSRNIVNAAEQSLYEGIGQEEGDKGNGLWVVNGLTTMYQNHKAVSNDETFFDSTLQGTIQEKVNEAVTLILALNTINAVK